VGASKILGIISVSTGWLLSWISIIVAIVGLSLVGLEKKPRDWAIALNILGIAEGVLAWVVWINYI
jgi:hypothetical protein